MAKLFVLFHHAAGYAVFKVKEFEEIGMQLPQLAAAAEQDISKFSSLVQLEGFRPFKSAVSALENQNAVSEGILTEDLKQFLDVTLPSKRKKVKLGLYCSKLGAAITEALGVECDYSKGVTEVLRGVRTHYLHFIDGLTAKSADAAALGLMHAYSRQKLKYNVNREDNMIIQSIALVDQYDKSINTMTMRLREWFSYNFPELVQIVPENFMFARIVKLIKNRKALNEDSLEELEKITMDSNKAQAILDAAKSSMGMDISPVDLAQIEVLADRVISSSNLREELSEYLRTRMNNLAPNLATLIGEQVGARLISHAGSLTKLAKCPASTVQILGAEKALFRALKTKSNTPKYGLLFHSTFIGRAGTKNKGRISRYLANKCSIASRIDCFADEPTSVFGEKMKQQVEDRLRFYETGDIPKKNIDVMEEAVEEQNKSIKHEAANGISEISNGDGLNGDVSKSEKKKKKKKDDNMNASQTEETEESPKKKKRRHSMSAELAVKVEEEQPKKKKKKNRKSEGDL